MKDQKKMNYEKPTMVTVVSEVKDVITASKGFNGDWDDLSNTVEPQELINF